MIAGMARRIAESNASPEPVLIPFGLVALLAAVVGVTANANSQAERVCEGTVAVSSAGTPNRMEATILLNPAVRYSGHTALRVVTGPDGKPVFEASGSYDEAQWYTRDGQPTDGPGDCRRIDGDEPAASGENVNIPVVADADHVAEAIRAAAQRQDAPVTS